MSQHMPREKTLQGFGVVAEKTFNAGDLVYEEAPLILWNSEDGQNHSRKFLHFSQKCFVLFFVHFVHVPEKIEQWLTEPVEYLRMA